LDIGVVFDYAGGSKGKDENDYKGLISLGPIGVGLYFGLGLNILESAGPHAGLGFLIGQNGFIAANIGIHAKRRVGVGIIIPIFPLYGTASTAEASSMSMALMPKIYEYLPKIGPYLSQIANALREGISYLSYQLQHEPLFSYLLVGIGATGTAISLYSIRKRIQKKDKEEDLGSLEPYMKSDKRLE
jgi:hypothetical protein